MRYGFTRGFARVVIAFGVLTILAGTMLALVALYVIPRYPVWGRPPSTAGHEEVAVAALLLAGGVLIGVVTIVFGQLVLVFLDVRARLVRIDRRLRNWEESNPERESPLVERLRPRR